MGQFCRHAALLLLLLGATHHTLASDDSDPAFEMLAARFVDQYPALSPVGATQLGDHRFDSLVDQVGGGEVKRQIAFFEKYLGELGSIDRNGLSRANQIDAALLENQLRFQIWSLGDLAEWQWNPLIYTQLAGGALYSLMARDFAPLPQRLNDATKRMRELPRFYEQSRAALIPEQVPVVFAQVASQQNRGVISIIDNMIIPNMSELDDDDRAAMFEAISEVRTAVEKHQRWLENKLIPKANGNFRIGRENFEKKLAFTLHTPYSSAEIEASTHAEYQRVRNEMYAVSKIIYLKKYPYTTFPDEPDDQYKEAITRAALEEAYRQTPGRDEIVAIATEQLTETRDFVAAKNLVSLPESPVEVIIMPEFQRGVTLAYCDSPGPLDRNLKTYYAVAPLPADWSEQQVESFLREYNLISLQDLTIHEAMPGHYLQLAHSNEYPSVLRAVLASGPFIEGWAVYAEQMMIDEGYQDGNPLMKLINLKWYLRAITNAIMDKAIHVHGMSRDEAMTLMVEGGFQEEQEAASKWVRAQLTSAQLSTYFVGFQEHIAMRAAVESAWGEQFELRSYHDQALSFGSPPVQFVRALLLEEAIPGSTQAGL